MATLGITNALGFLRAHWDDLAVLATIVYFLGGIRGDLTVLVDQTGDYFEDDAAQQDDWLVEDRDSASLSDANQDQMLLLLTTMNNTLDRQTVLLEENNEQMAVQTVQLDMLLRERFGAVGGNDATDN